MTVKTHTCALVGVLAVLSILGSAKACPPLALCADVNFPANGIRDDNCMSWICSGGACFSAAIPFGDMGGPFGLCAPDLAVDANDAFHALNCFSNINPVTGVPPYPCNPGPGIYNTDAGGLFGSCCPDGTCDGNDAFHALNVFAGSSACGCPISGLAHSCPPPNGPEPSFEPEPVAIAGHADLVLIPSSPKARPGDHVEVDVFMNETVHRMEGYQLHFGVTGGKRGVLDSVDIAILDDPDAVFPELAEWQAFNVDTRQMVAIGAPVETAGRLGYLATVTFEVSKDALGTFAVDLLYDDADGEYRTFLFGEHGQSKIAIQSTAPAVIEVVEESGKSRSRNMRSR